MKKAEAVKLLGGTISKAARELRVTASAVSQWPDDGDIPEQAENRVLAWLARKHLPIEAMLDQGAQGQESPAAGTSLGEAAASHQPMPGDLQHAQPRAA